MKKIIFVLLAISIVVGLVACGDSESIRQQEYIEALEEFRSLSLAVGVEAETLSGLTRDVWNDAIRQNFEPNTRRYVMGFIDGSNWDEKEEAGYDFARLEHSIQRGYRLHIVGARWNDFNEALAALSASPATIERRSEIEQGRGLASSAYLQLGSAPDGLERAETAASSMFESLDILISLATNPTGSLTSYSESRRDAIDEFMRNYRLLGDIIDAFGD